MFCAGPLEFFKIVNVDCELGNPNEGLDLGLA